MASKLHHHMKKRTHHDDKKGTLSDDVSYVVRQGTEANRLIASAAGLEAIIPKGMQHQVEQIQEWVAVPERQEKPCSMKVLFRRFRESIISLSHKPDLGQTILPTQRLLSPYGRR
jgi:hypothetical protein